MNKTYTIENGNMNDILEKMAEFLAAAGWTVLNNCTADTAPNAAGLIDGGKILAVFRDDVYAVMRSAVGQAIFYEQTNHSVGVTSAGAYGIGLTSCTNYTANPSSGFWYDQVNAPVNTDQNIIGVGISPIQGKSGNFTLFCNATTSPSVGVVFTLKEVTNDKSTGNVDVVTYQHLAFGKVQKVGSWVGGTYIAGSKSSYNMFLSASAVQGKMPETLDKSTNILFGMSSDPSFLVRCDVDSAPILDKPVLWLSSGPQKGNMSTGKILATSLTNHVYLNSMPKVPHWGYIQSQNSTDYGRNVNTLNCITVNLPIYLYVQRDPNSLMNFSVIGYIPNVTAISMRNVAPDSMYEINYPKSGTLHQVFPHCVRGGYHGYDGISVMQETTTIDEGNSATEN